MSTLEEAFNAISKGNKNALVLMDLHSFINSTKSNETLLYTACKGGHVEIVKLLLSVSGIDVNNDVSKFKKEFSSDSREDKKSKVSKSSSEYLLKCDEYSCLVFLQGLVIPPSFLLSWQLLVWTCLLLTVVIDEGSPFFAYTTDEEPF